MADTTNLLTPEELDALATGIEDGSIDKVWLEPNGHDKGQPFMFTREFELANGAHRLACALYFLSLIHI